jgi:hypothetical protein
MRTILMQRRLIPDPTFPEKPKKPTRREWGQGALRRMARPRPGVGAGSHSCGRGADRGATRLACADFVSRHPDPIRSLGVRRIGVMWLAMSAVLAVSGCASPPEEPVNLLAPTEEQAKLRNVQTRHFDITDRREAMRGVISALQDLGFIIERANEPLGLVTAARFAEPHYYDVVGVTVTVRKSSESRTTIRANAIFNNEPITDPEVYRNFFATLQRSFLLGRN